MARFRIDHNHRQRLKSPLQNQISVVVVIHNALDAVVEGHASQEFDGTVRFMMFMCEMFKLFRHCQSS